MKFLTCTRYPTSTKPVKFVWRNLKKELLEGCSPQDIPAVIDTALVIKKFSKIVKFLLLLLMSCWRVRGKTLLWEITEMTEELIYLDWSLWNTMVTREIFFVFPYDKATRQLEILSSLLKARSCTHPKLYKTNYSRSLQVSSRRI